MQSQSSTETRSRAERLAKAIGAHHTDMNIDDVFTVRVRYNMSPRRPNTTQAERDLLTKSTGFAPKFKVYGGSNAENLALQNIQARTRMVVSVPLRVKRYSYSLWLI